MPSQYIKDPSEKLDYAVDWADPKDGPWLTGGDILATSTFTSTPSGLTLTSPSKTDTLAKVWVDGGTDGTDYTVTNAIVTAQGRVSERSFRISVRQR